MNRMKIPLILTITTYLTYKVMVYTTGYPLVSLLVFILPILILSSHLILRRKLRYRSWFLNKSNRLVERIHQETTSDISSELLFEKLVEVINKSEFNLLDTDPVKLQVLASTSVNFWTWGENIYIEVIPTNETSQVNLTSVTIFGNYSWNRNKKNHEHFYRSFEESLTI
ncbi:MAG: hypothetical protein MK066_14210 [Crocinitomicaceae bacterium]|nr:hypothetical protein [Crocinitomicaceae bacterium]